METTGLGPPEADRLPQSPAFLSAATEPCFQWATSTGHDRRPLVTASTTAGREQPAGGSQRPIFPHIVIF